MADSDEFDWPALLLALGSSSITGIIQYIVDSQL